MGLAAFAPKKFDAPRGERSSGIIMLPIGVLVAFSTMRRWEAPAESLTKPTMPSIDWVHVAIKIKPLLRRAR